MSVGKCQVLCPMHLQSFTILSILGHFLTLTLQILGHLLKYLQCIPTYGTSKGHLLRHFGEIHGVAFGLHWSGDQRFACETLDVSRLVGFLVQ